MGGTHSTGRYGHLVHRASPGTQAVGWLPFMSGTYPPGNEKTYSHHLREVWKIIDSSLCQTVGGYVSSQEGTYVVAILRSTYA